MSQAPSSHASNLGSRIHFLIAAVVAVAFSVGLTSTAAMAGLSPAAQSETADAPDPFAITSSARSLMTSAIPRESMHLPATSSIAVAAADVAARPYLEADPEFAPKFQHVVARGRPASHAVLDRLGCGLSIARFCARASRL